MSKTVINGVILFTIINAIYLIFPNNVSANAWIRMDLTRADDLCGAHSLYKVPVLKSGSAAVSNGVVLGDLRCTTGTSGRRATNLRQIDRVKNQKLADSTRGNSRQPASRPRTTNNGQSDSSRPSNSYQRTN